MKAYILQGTGTAGALQLTDLPVPVLQADEVLVNVKAIDINPVDNKTLQGAGQYNNIKQDNPIILGWDVSGEVVETGSEVTTFTKGDEVFGLINFPGHGKTYAEYVAAPAKHLAKKPGNISHEDAVAATLSALIAYQAVHKANIQPHERVLIQGAAGGVGVFAVQIAKALGAYVIGTAQAKDKAWLTTHGLNEMINYTTTDFEKATSAIDFVLDILGGQHVIKAFNILSPNGRLITIPSGAGDEWKAIAAERHIHADFQFVHSSGEDMQALALLLETGKIFPCIAHHFQFGDIPDIHRQMLARKISGKIVVSL